MAPRDLVDSVEWYRYFVKNLVDALPSTNVSSSYQSSAPRPPKDNHRVSACAKETSKLWNTAKSS